MRRIGRIRNFVQLLSSLSSVLVAGMLFYTGLIHAAQPYYFIHSISSYRLLPAGVSCIIGLWLPYPQIVLVLCIGLRIAEKVALYTAASVFTAFALAQMTVLMRGMEIDCGCFGFVAHTVSPVSIMLPIALVCACTLAAISGHRVEGRASGPSRPR